jgi:hypothetical protein
VASEVSPTTTRSGAEQAEDPTESATLQIRTSPPGIALRAEGAVTRIMVLGVIGPAAVILARHLASLPVWATALVCVLQVVAAVARRRS